MDDAEFWEFYARYRGIALRAAKTILKNEAEAEDVCQDIFETLYHMEQDKVNRQTMGAMIREQIQKIFTPFVTYKPSGTGLGLAVTKEIITAHHGSLTVDSAPGQGSVFRIFLK